MSELNPLTALLLLAGSFAAGVVNTLAGGGSFFSVPLLIACGLPAGVANGTNRVGILLQSLAATGRFRRAGLIEVRALAAVAAPVALGSLIGALWVSGLDDALFQRLFGLFLLVLLVPLLRTPRAEAPAPAPWPPAAVALAGFVVGLYAGAFQAGVGIPLLLLLVRSGRDPLRANALKVAIVALSAGVSVPVFVAQQQVHWRSALCVALGYGLGGWAGAQGALRYGAPLLRPLLALAALLLAGHLLGLY